MSDTPPKTLTEWIAYLHNAVTTPKTSPNYQASREAAHFAVQRIHNLGVAADATDPDQQAKQSAAVQAIGVGLLHSFGLGTGEPIAGLISAAQGKGFREGAAQYREGLGNVQAAHPNAEIGGEATGLVGTSLLPIDQAVGGGTALAQGIRTGRANAIQRFATGLMHTNVVPGAVIGGITGFSQGGDDPGDIKARVNAAALGAGAGAGASALLGGFGAMRVPRWVANVAPRVKSALGKGAAPEEVANVAEAAIRSRLAKEGYSASNIEQLVQTWKGGGNPAPISQPRVETPVSIRPGETITQTSPRGFEVTGVRETPPVPTAPTIAEIHGVTTRNPSPDVGMGKTLPYYPRGGQVEQAFGPQPISSTPSSAAQLAPNQNAAFIEFLKGATDPKEITSRVGTLQALGVLQPQDVPILLQMLGVR